jgi:hypothetical protein
MTTRFAFKIDFSTLETSKLGSLDGTRKEGESGNGEEPAKGRKMVEGPMRGKRQMRLR